MAIPQITIFLDSTGRPHAEAPGKNGSRLKIDLPFDFDHQNPEIMAELRAQADSMREKHRAALRQTQNQNIQTTADHHGPYFARQIWHNPDLLFSRAMTRKILATETEATTTPTPPTKTKKSTTVTPKFNIQI